MSNLTRDRMAHVFLCASMFLLALGTVLGATSPEGRQWIIRALFGTASIAGLLLAFLCWPPRRSP